MSGATGSDARLYFRDQHYITLPGRVFLNILSINSMVPPEVFGGAEVSALNLSRELSLRGHAVTMLGAFEYLDRPWRDEHLDIGGTTVRSLQFYSPSAGHAAGTPGLVDKAVTHWRDLFNPMAAGAIRRAVEATQPDIALVHNTPAISAEVFRVLGAKAIPTIHILHDQGLICLNRGAFRGGHECPGWCMPCRATTPIRVGALRRVKRVALVSPSRFNLAAVEARADLSDLPRYVIPNANLYPVFPRPPREPGAVRLLFVGRIAAEKGVDVAIEAVRRLQDRTPVALDILGKGPDSAALATHAAGLPIRFHGQVDLDTVGRTMAAADLLLLPSLWAENFPGVAVHALQSGLPVIASHVGGIPEIVTDGVEGRLLPPGGPEAWAEAIAALAANPERRAAMGAAALAKGAAYQPSAIADRFERLMHSMAAAPMSTEGP